ncbi:MAG: NOB1 family endonuclease [Candidatus Bathyarchaeia archaeon]
MNIPDSRENVVLVLDTSAFVAGFDPFSMGTEHFTTPKVEEELRVNSMTTLRFRTAVESGKLKIIEPDQEFLGKVEAAASSVGDVFYLSETDKQVLALALQLQAAGYKPRIVTDDYSMQNVASQMGLEFVSLATFGIRRLLKWVRYCPACRREYPANFKANTCPVCGTRLKRKPQRPERKPR